MTEPVTFDAPSLDAPRLPSVGVRDEKWQRERVTFFKMLPDLLAGHRDRYVAIHEGQVVATGDDSVSVAKEAYARFGYVPMYVGLVTDPPPRAVRVPSFRPVSWGSR